MQTKRGNLCISKDLIFLILIAFDVIFREKRQTPFKTCMLWGLYSRIFYAQLFLQQQKLLNLIGENNAELNFRWTWFSSHINIFVIFVQKYTNFSLKKVFHFWLLRWTLFHLCLIFLCPIRCMVYKKLIYGCWFLCVYLKLFSIHNFWLQPLGLYFYKLQDPSVPVNTDDCIAWKASQETPYTYNRTMTAILSDHKRFKKAECPCKRTQALRHSAYRRNRLVEFPGQYMCFYRKRLLKVDELTDTFISTNCCYDRLTNALIFTQNEADEMLLTRNHFVKSQLTQRKMNRRGTTRRNFHTYAMENDLKAYKDCCMKSDLCEQFESRRRIPTCEYYKVPLRGIS